ncbi:MAG: MFS transporter [Bacteroidota bacterium]|nr:MFS transporter [Bacteroidota bacterium]
MLPFARRTSILIIIVLAQFLCVSLWFAGNGVMDDLIRDYGLSDRGLGNLTTAVQLGFILGTLLFSLFAVADRSSPSKVFMVSAFLAASCNIILLFSDHWSPGIYASRFLTGFFLAGIYPVGMKIAADYFDVDLGKALGYLLGALVLGTAFPHLLKSQLHGLPWETVIIATSIAAVIGGLLIFFLIPDGPFRRPLQGLRIGVLPDLFIDKNFRAAACGYFGHMWELYAFWAFVPVIISVFVRSLTPHDISLVAFFIIGIGSIGCILGGYAAQRFGSFKIAFLALMMSALCCLISPLIFTLHPVIILIFFLFWGMMVIMDSPQFSTLVAIHAPVMNKASALTLVNCIGFSITIISIQLLTILSAWLSYQWLLFLLFPGPVLGLLAMIQSRQVTSIEKSIP